MNKTLLNGLLKQKVIFWGMLITILVIILFVNQHSIAQLVSANRSFNIDKDFEELPPSTIVESKSNIDFEVGTNPNSVNVVSSATDYFRSNVSNGNWNVPGSWESSADSINNWVTATLVPNSAANYINIRMGHNITINNAVTADQIIVEFGGTLTHTSGLTVANGAEEDDILIHPGGSIIYETSPVYNSSVIRITGGGILSMQGNGLAGNGTGVNASTHVYDEASVLEWNLATAVPAASGVTFFPNANAATVPIFRFKTGVSGSIGGGSTTVINGKIEVATGVTITFTGAGTKTFRNGIKNGDNLDYEGHINQGSAGQIIINGAVAELGGGNLTLGTNGLSINAVTTATLSSDKVIQGTGTINNVGIISLNNHTLAIPAITGAGTIKGTANSNLIVQSTGTLNFTAGSRSLYQLIVTAGTSTLGTALDVYGLVKVSNGATLASGGNLTLKSTNDITASFGANTSGGNYITGDVTVERYIPNNGFRSWRLLSVPTNTAQTIRQAWQEGIANPNPLNNNLPEYGTQITSTGALATATAAGFDNTTLYTGLLTYNSGANTWEGAPSTNAPIFSKAGYFLYVRGERTQGITGATNNSTATTLRTKGPLYLGNQTSASITANTYGLVGNLYASAIDFSQLNRTGGISNKFYIWDSKKISGVSLGVYQTFSSTNGFNCLIAGGSYTLGQPNTRIESGQAFFVQAEGSAGDITLTENSKEDFSSFSQGLRPTTALADLVKIDTRLFTGITATADMADANVVVFDNAYANAVDADDAVKLPNAGENFAIAKAGKKLVIEGRQLITNKDTIFFDMWNIKQQAYKLELVPQNLIAQGLIAFLQDSYLNSNTPINLSAASTVNFRVDANAASSKADRFRIVFTKTTPLPVNFISISANRNGSAVQVDWKVAAERGIRNYEVERSFDGRNFISAATVVANGNSVAELAYSWMDINAAAVVVYYRIKSNAVSGEVKYTNIVKLAAGFIKPGFSISPNPIEGEAVNLQFKNQPEGRYNIRLLSMNGQLVFAAVATHAGGNSTQLLNLLEGTKPGSYQLEIITPDKSRITERLIKK